MKHWTKVITLIAGIVCAFAFAGTIHAAEASGQNASLSFDGEKSAWHGFDRYDFILDEDTLAIAPFKSLAGEGDGVKDPAKGQRRCIVVVPKVAAPGNPWSWQGCYWDHQPQAEVELLRRGFHIAYISANATLKLMPSGNSEAQK
jgi:hypothetical protein